MKNIELKKIDFAAPVEITAAKGEGKAPTFSMCAYSGGALSVWAYDYPVVLALKGMTFNQATPTRFQHDENKGVGHTEKVSIVSNQLHASGVISRDTSYARDVINSSKHGFPWKASVGAYPTKIEWFGEGETVQANGQEFEGPVYVAWESRLGEISFVDVPADDGTSVEVKAKKGENMKDKQKTSGGQEKDPKTPVEGNEQPEKPVEASKDKPKEPLDPIQASRADAAAELRRIASIQKLCAGSPEIAASAVEEGWTAERAELEMLRASRPKAPAVIIPEANVNAKVLEASLMMSMPNLDQKSIQARYDEKTLDATAPFRRMGLKALIEAACAIDGRVCPGHNSPREEWVKAAFSTRTLTNLLANVANKAMMEAYNQIPPLARKVFAKLNANDFKKHTGVRLSTVGTLRKVGGDGEVKYGQLSDGKYEYEIDTFAELIGFTRQDFINDDLGMLQTIPILLGHKAGRTVEKAAWDLVLANTGSYFSSDNSNYQTGADTALAIAGLDKAVQAFGERVDGNGDAILVEPKYLVVPPALRAEAERIYRSQVLIATGTGSTKKLDAGENNHQGMYEPVSVPQLKGSPKVWYLFADQNICPAFGIAYLNGIEAPTVEEVAPEADILGTAFRCVLDFGVCQINKEGAEKMKGEA